MTEAIVTVAFLIGLAALVYFLAFRSQSLIRPKPPLSSTGWRLEHSQATIEGNVITFGEVHYVTRPTGPLSGTIRLSFHLDAIPTGVNGGPATASLYFQRKGDDYQASAETEAHRWWTAPVTLDRVGDYTLTASLAGPWGAVMTSRSDTNPAGFAAAKANAESVGFTIGDHTGLGHGAIGPAKLTIKEWEITP